MFVLKSRYDLVVTNLEFTTQRFQKLQRQWNDLIDRINAKGGESFLNSKPLQFNDDEIRGLIVLCHPDKHAGSKLAHDLTAKLTTMRRKSSNPKINPLDSGAPRAGSQSG